jgi:serine/threonine protein kinase/Rieske Fe-S protein
MVYLAYHSIHNRPAALTTFILPNKFSPEAHQYFLLRFRKETSRLAALQHPHILPVYDYGEYIGYPYMVTPYMTNGSLADMLKRQDRFRHADVQNILQQMIAGLASAHGKGIFHGALNPSNIVLNDQQQMLVAGFGLMQILQMRGIEQDEYAHLFSVGGTFLTPAEYLAPEIVQGQPGDARTDVYALGMILFRLFSGKTPFTGANPLEVAKQHVQLSVPSLRMYSPDIPLALVSVVNQALDRDPTRRFQTIEELGEAFAQVSTTISEQRVDLPTPIKKAFLPTRSTRNTDPQETPAGGYTLGNWQLMPPIVTEKLTAFQPTSRGIDEQSSALPSYLIDSSPLFVLPTPQKPVVPAPEPIVNVSKPQPQNQEELYNLWSLPKPSPQWSEPLPLLEPAQWNGKSSVQRLTANQSPFESAKKRGKDLMTRRKVVASLVTGGVAVAAVAIGINLTATHQPAQPAQTTQVSVNAANLAKNAALNFTNAKGEGNVLVHLVDGTFAAYDRACTHVGVYVNYNPATKLLVCPAHGAIFDPAKNGAVVQGPATTPLPKVAFHITANGTVTV